MRHLITGLIAAVAVMAAAPAMACGYSGCWQPPVYVAPVAAVGYSGCNPCVGWTRERLPDPEQQYYYVNQGPTYTGPGNCCAVPGLSGRLGLRLRLWLQPSALRLSRAPLRPCRALLRPARAAPLLLIQHNL